MNKLSFLVAKEKSRTFFFFLVILDGSHEIYVGRRNQTLNEIDSFLDIKIKLDKMDESIFLFVECLKNEFIK